MNAPLSFPRTIGLRLSLALVLAGLTGAGPFCPKAQAEAEYRRDVVQAAQAAQEALSGKKPADALRKLSAVRALTDLNPDERLLTDRLAAVAALDAQQPEAAIGALEAVLGNPKLSPADRPALIDAMVKAASKVEDSVRTEKWARACADAGCPVQRMRPYLLQALSQQKKHGDVIREMKPVLSDPVQAKAVTEFEWRVLGFSQQALKDNAGYVQTLTQLLAIAPSKDYWSDLLTRLPGQPGFNPRLELDVYRLMADTDCLEEAAEYLDMARLSVKAGLPAEAVGTVERARARGLAKDAATDALLKQAKQRAAEDEQSLPQMLKAARDADSWSQLALVHFAGGRWAEAQQAWASAFAAGTPKHADEARLHQGIAQLRAGQAQAARETLAKVGGDAAQLARLWQLRLK